MAAMIWRKSSRSGSNGANCVEVASFPQAIGIRDSKDRKGPQLTVAVQAFGSLLSEIKAGKHEL